MSKSSKAYDAIVKGRSWLIINHIFFGSLIMELKFRETKEVPTMATDGRHLYFNPDFTLELSEQELIGVLVHELYHCILKHHIRIADRQHLKWNIAGDYVINLIVTAAGFILPKGGLLDDQYAGMVTEEVYNRLPNPEKKKGGGGSEQADKGNSGGQGGSDGQGPGNAQDPGMCGGVLPSRPAWDKAGLEADDSEWTQKVQQAANVAKAQNAGNYPSYVKRIITDLMKPKFDWQSYLRRFVDESNIEIESWLSPDKRFLHSGVVLPGRLKDGVNHIVCAIDTSGSISQSLLKAYLSELQAFLDEGLCDKLTILFADTKVHTVHEFERGDLLTGLDATGGGGTAFSNTFLWIKKNVFDATIILYFTDLFVADFGEQPEAPVVWCVYGTEQEYDMVKDRPPFGESLAIRE